MSTTMTTTTRPRRSRLDRRTAMRLAADEYVRFADALAALDADDWTKPTECPAWDVRQMACHTVGMAEMASGFREQVRQQRKAGADAAASGSSTLDALTALQVSERADWSPERTIAGMRSVAPRAARGRRRMPGLVRRMRLPEQQDVGGRKETWTIGFVSDTILTRDPWMHRMDIARATGRAPVLTADHDGVIVADVVEEWAERHGLPSGSAWADRPGAAGPPATAARRSTWTRSSSAASSPAGARAKAS